MSSNGTFHFKALPSAIRAAQIVGITSAAALSGYIASFSILLVPTINTEPPSKAAKQWAKAYAIGASTSPYLAILPTLSFSYLASQAAKLPKVWYNTPLDIRPSFTLYTTAAVLVPAIIPFTLFVMTETNDKLHAKASGLGTDVKEDEEVGKLLSKWQLLNSVRALFPGVAAVVGLWAVIARPEVVGLSLDGLK